MDSRALDPRLVHRTARIRLQVTRHQADRCYGLLRSAGDVWAWLLDTNRQRVQHGLPPVVGYQALCRELTARGPTGELSTVGARSVLGRYSDAWFQAAKRRRRGEPAGFPRRKRRLVPIRCYHGTFLFRQGRVRLPVAKAIPCCGCGWPAPFPIPSSKSERSRCSPMGGGGCEAGTQARAEGVTALAPSPAPRAA
jgi:transposase